MFDAPELTNPLEISPNFQKGYDLTKVCLITLAVWNGIVLGLHQFDLGHPSNDVQGADLVGLMKNKDQVTK